MSYTLVSAAVLGFELVSIPAGPTVAHALLTGLTADSDDLLQLASRPLQSGFEPLRMPVGYDPQSYVADDQLTASSTPVEVADRLRRSCLDGPAALARLVRADILGADCRPAQDLDDDLVQRAADVLVGAVLRGWAADDDILDTGPRAEGVVFAGWQNGRCLTGDLGPHTAAVRDVLRSLLVPATLASWRSATPADTATWTAAMHQACWAAHLSGRVREAAVAQLLGVLSFREAGMGTDPAALGIWRALSGMLQAIVVHDLLDPASSTALLSPAYAVAVPAPTGILTSSSPSSLQAPRPAGSSAPTPR